MQDLNKKNNLYRKYRPKNFNEIVGQNDVVTLLKNSISLKSIGSAYILSGSRGIGKTSIARIFSKAINCLKPINNDCCNVCDNCNLINNNKTIDFIEIDAASNNSVNDVRQISENISYVTSNLKYKIYIIDEAHMLTTSAWNAFLKTLEETPDKVIFIFATTEYFKIPLTIISRCQKYIFHKIKDSELFSQINKIAKMEQIIIDDDSCKLIAKLSDGSLRDALSILEQSSIFSDSKISTTKINKIFGLLDNDKKIEIIKNIQTPNYAKIITIINELEDQGVDFYQLSFDLVQIFLDKYVYEKTKNKNLINFSDYSTILEINIQPNFLNKMIDIFNDSIYKMKRNLNHKFFFELACIEAIKIFDFNIDKKNEKNINEKIEVNNFLKKTIIDKNTSSTIKQNDNMDEMESNFKKEEKIDDLESLINESIKLKSVKLKKIKSLFGNNKSPQENFENVSQEANSSLSQNLIKEKINEFPNLNFEEEFSKKEKIASHDEFFNINKSNSIPDDLHFDLDKKFELSEDELKISKNDHVQAIHDLNKEEIQNIKEDSLDDLFVDKEDIFKNNENLKEDIVKEKKLLEQQENLFSISLDSNEPKISFGKPKDMTSSHNPNKIMSNNNFLSPKFLLNEIDNSEIFCKIAFNRNANEKEKLNKILDDIKKGVPLNSSEGSFVDAEKIILVSTNGFVVLYNDQLHCDNLNSINDSKDFILYIKNKFGKVFKVIGVLKEEAKIFTDEFKKYLDKKIKLSDVDISNLLSVIVNENKKISDKDLAMELLGDLIE